MSNLSIGRIAKLTGAKITTIRFYEQIGLLPKPLRTPSERRIYDADAVRRLGFIRHARQLGFSVEAIRDLLELTDHPDRDCRDATAIARAQLTAIEAKIRQLQALRVELARMVSTDCGGSAAHCRIIESLSQAAPSAAIPSFADAVSPSA